jgi:hypothetical protein
MLVSLIGETLVSTLLSPKAGETVAIFNFGETIASFSEAGETSLL